MTDHANELRRYSRKIGHPAGDVPSVMLAAADEIERLAARLEAAEKELAELRSSMKFRTSLIGRTEAERDALRVENAALVDDMNLLRNNNTALRAKITRMEQQKPVAWLHESRRNSDVITSAKKHVWGKAAARSMDAYSIPLYALPGAQPAPSLASDDVSLISEGKTQPAQSVTDAIIDDLQSQFDTEGIIEHDSGDALIRLSDAIAAVEDNFAQPAPSIPDDVMRDAKRYRFLRAAKNIPISSKAARDPVVYDEAIDAAMLAVAPEAKI
jgi:hypothetical protein